MSDKNEKAVIAYLKTHLKDILWRDVLQDLLTLPDRTEVTFDAGSKAYWIDGDSPCFAGKLVVHGKDFYRVDSFTTSSDKTKHFVTLSPTGFVDEDQILLNPRRPIILQKGVIENFTDDTPIKTCVGRLMLNYMALVDPFGSIIPYQNFVWSPKKIEGYVKDAILSEKVTVEQVNRYGANATYYGHSPEFVAPNLTLRSLTSATKDIASLKKKLLEEHKEGVENEDPTVTSHIEEQLIAADKNYLKGDESLNYFLKGKVFSNIRKKLYLAHGTIEQFGDAGSYNFISNSLEEGWDPKRFPAYANEIRDGTFSRSTEVAKGGEGSKFIQRVFQNARILEQDCKTSRTLDIVLRPDNASKYFNRNLFEDGRVITLTKDNVSQFMDRQIHLRDASFCGTKGGYCFTCMGKQFEILNQINLATSLTGLTSGILTRSLKKAHTSGVSTTKISDLNRFVFV